MMMMMMMMTSLGPSALAGMTQSNLPVLSKAASPNDSFPELISISNEIWMSGKYFPLALASGEPAKSVGGSEVELLIKDGREERNGLSFTKGREQSVGVRPRRLGSSDTRRKDDDLFRSELKSRVCRFRATFKPRALLYSSFFIAFFVFAQVGSVGAGRPGHLLCLAGIR